MFYFFVCCKKVSKIPPCLGKPLKNRRDFSALAVRPFDASHVGVSGIGINSINAAMHIPQLIPLTSRQFAYPKYNTIN